MPFSQEFIVPYYECDETAKMKVSAAVRFMQHIASVHIESLGISHMALFENSMVFLLGKTFSKISRLPNAGELIKVSTAPVRCKGPKFYRDVVIYDENGERCVSFMTIWMLVDPASRKILRPSTFPYELPFEESLVTDVVSEDRFPQIGDFPLIKSKDIIVEYSHIDNNGHVNNSVYVDFACNMLNYSDLVKKGIDKVMVSYQSEAVPNDTISIDCYDLGNYSYHFVGTKAGGPCFESVIKLKD